MAEGVGNAILVEIAKRVIQPAADIIVGQFIYLFCYKKNINKLNERVAQLKLTREDAESFMDSSADHNEEATNTSIAWMNKVKAAEGAANGINEATKKQKTWCFRNWCLNPKQRYLLSKNAVKIAEEIQHLLAEGKVFVPSIKHALPPSKLTGALANDGSKDLRTRSMIMDDLMKALKDDKISIIGICGTGGVGKTTLMHELRERVKVNDLFNEVAMTTVSQNPDWTDIRCKLAEMLGLTSVETKKNEIAAADEIYKRLTGKGRRTLVILDDIWEAIKLEELGIPIESDQTDCKVVVTSRYKETCLQMKAHKIISVAIMPPEEAWYLFRKTAGDCVECDDLKEIAKKVADECGGLPIALVTLAKALSNKDIKIWRDAHNQLRKHSVTRIPDMHKKVYSSIKMSYDFLKKEQPEIMSLLLLCCQHPEDAAIKVEDLVRYCLALRLFKNIDTLEGVRDAVFSSIEYLKSCFLLEEETDTNREYFRSFRTVKMHDIMRDVGLKEEIDGVYMSYAMPAMLYKPETSEAPNYQGLKILHLGEECHHQYTSFLSQMEELRVLVHKRCLNFSDNHLHPVEGLTNLRMLILKYSLLRVDSLSKIARLTKLELLSLQGSVIGPFPHQIRQLSNLKLLDLRSCTRGNVRTRRNVSYTIPRGILAELNKLEELHLGNYYFSSTPENGEIHGRIAELEKLSNLTALQIQLENPLELLDLDFRFKKLQRFYFSSLGDSNWLSGFDRNLSLRKVYMEWISSDRIESIVRRRLSGFDRNLSLRKVHMEWISSDRIESIVRRTELLELTMMDNWTDPLILKKFVSLRELEICSGDIKYLISDVGANNSAFTKLERLDLVHMDGLTELCHNGNLPAGSLRKLRRLCFYKLTGMRHLWVGPTDCLCLANLRYVRIEYCWALECIFPHSAVKCLVQLQELTVKNCGNLKEIVSKGEGTCTGRGGKVVEKPTDLNILHFPKLRVLAIRNLNNFRGFYELDDDYVQCLLSPLVMVPSMRRLEIRYLDQLKQIVGVRIIAITKLDWLPNLEVIVVTSCASLDSVFDFEGLTENAPVITLGKLKHIYLSTLPKLTRIFCCCRIQDITIPELQTIKVSRCHKLENLVASNVIKLLHNLKGVHIEDCKTLETVFDFEGLEVRGELDAHAILGELQRIRLTNLPKLEHLCRLAEAPKEIHVFQNLRELHVFACDGLAYLFSSSVALMLEKLESLSIKCCNSIRECIVMNEEYVDSKIVFRFLRELVFVNMEKLSSFCSGDKLEFEFPSLKDVTMIGCPEMKMFCYGRMTAENLHGVTIDEQGSKLDWKGDLNQTLLQHFNARDRKANNVGDKDDKNVEDDINGTEQQQLNTRVNQMSIDLKQDNVSDYNAADVGDIHVPAKIVQDEDIQHSNEVLDNSGSSSSTQPEQGIPPEVITKEFPPQTTAHSTCSPSALNDAQEFADSRKKASPSLAEVVLAPSTEMTLQSSDASMETEAKKALSDSSSSSDDSERSRILIQGVYIKSNMKKTFEEILNANPNCLSGIRVKTAVIKTALVETAINCLETLRQGGITLEQLESIRDSLDDLAANGFDVGWLEKEYEKASIGLDEEKVVLWEAELAELERVKMEDEAVFQMAKEKLEASTALRDAFKVKFDGLKQRLGARKKLFGGSFDVKTSVADGLKE